MRRKTKGKDRGASFQSGAEASTFFWLGAEGAAEATELVELAPTATGRVDHEQAIVRSFSHRLCGSSIWRALDRASRPSECRGKHAEYRPRGLHGLEDVLWPTVPTVPLRAIRRFSGRTGVTYASAPSLNVGMTAITSQGIDRLRGPGEDEEKGDHLCLESRL